MCLPTPKKHKRAKCQDNEAKHHEAARLNKYICKANHDGGSVFVEACAVGFVSVVGFCAKNINFYGSFCYTWMLLVFIFVVQFDPMYTNNL